MVSLTILIYPYQVKKKKKIYEEKKEWTDTIKKIIKKHINAKIPLP